jgi:riboflavin synthase
MFTGLIEEVGVITSVHPLGNGRKLTVQGSVIMDDLKIDDSVAINGVCQTVIARTEHSFTVEAVEETLKKTTFASFRNGMPVNLERALRVGDRLGGHIVQGHADCRAMVSFIEQRPESWLVSVTFPEEYSRYTAPTGSICIDGVSLTTAHLLPNGVTVSVIPHTWKVTTLARLYVGAEVNIEFDIIGKYVERLLLRPASGESSAGLTEEKLAAFGFW